MPSRSRLLLGALLALLLLAAWFAWTRLQVPELLGEARTSRVTAGLPVVMPTPGGRLEISSVTVYERFTHENVKTLLGVELHVLGKTVSHLQLKTVYRYHIEMAKQWPIERRGEQWIVRAGEVQPTLPVGFDTRDLEHYTREGWARFDRQESLVELLRGMSGELEKRAASPAYRQLAREAGRKTVAEFVRNWLLSSRAVRDASRAKVVVLFPGEELGEQQ